MSQNNNFCKFIIVTVDERHTLPVFILFKFTKREREIKGNINEKEK